jgi:hypothetical protein
MGDQGIGMVAPIRRFALAHPESFRLELEGDRTCT